MSMMWLWSASSPTAMSTYRRPTLMAVIFTMWHSMDPRKSLRNLLEFRKSVDPDHYGNKRPSFPLAATETANINSLKLLIQTGADTSD